MQMAGIFAYDGAYRSTSVETWIKQDAPFSCLEERTENNVILVDLTLFFICDIIAIM